MERADGKRKMHQFGAISVKSFPEAPGITLSSIPNAEL
jgi:hypothetical protein